MEEEYEEEGWMGRHRSGEDEVKYSISKVLLFNCV